MNKLKLHKRTGIAILIIAGMLGIMACGSHHGHHGKHGERFLKKATRKLDLTVEQSALLQQVVKTAEDFKGEFNTEHENLSEPFKTNLSQPELNLDQLNQHFEDLESKLHAFRKDILGKYAEFHSSLDQDQRTRIVGMLEKMEKRHKQ